MNIPLSPYVPESLVSRDGSSRLVPHQPAHLHTQAESGAYSRDSSRFPPRRPFISLNRHTPSGQSRVYRVTQLRTDGVHCRESAGTGPVVLKVVPVTGAAILQVTMGQIVCAPLFSHTHYWYEVGCNNTLILHSSLACDPLKLPPAPTTPPTAPSSLPLRVDRSYIIVLYWRVVL